MTESIKRLKPCVYVTYNSDLLFRCGIIVSSVYTLMASFIPTLTMINLNTVITISYAVGTAEEQSPC